jgi:Uma2 family endonuclease
MAAPATVQDILESGDRLTRDEFHRRYGARPDIKKAELVEGVVYVASPVSARFHGQPHADVMLWLGTYRLKHPGLLLADNATLRLDDKNEVQPDACLWREEPDGPHLDDKGYIVGPPQLVVEVAASSASYDLHDKKEAYRRNGVREYVVWRVTEGMIDWFRLQGGEYEWVEPDDRGVVTSAAFPGLCLDLPKMLAGDLAGVLKSLG